MSEQRGKREDVLTELRRTISADETDIPVNSVAPFSDGPNRIIINGERIRYAEKVPGDPAWFTGCTRGANIESGGTPPKRHPGGTQVRQDVPDEIGAATGEVSVIARPLFNFLNGGGIEVDIADDPENDRSNIILTATGGNPIESLAGVGTRAVEADTDGVLSANVSLGLVFLDTDIFSAVTSVSLDNVFTSTYETYEIVWNADLTTAAAQLSFRLRAGGVDLAGAGYYSFGQRISETAISAAYGIGGQSVAIAAQGVAAGTINAGGTIRITDPAVAAQTHANIHASGLWAGVDRRTNIGGFHNIHATAYDGFTLFPSSGTMSGRVWIYGLRDS